MIDESMARIFWPNADPIGQHLVISGPAPYQIVGIVGDVRQFGLDQKPQPEMYVAQDQEEWRSFTIVARCKTAPLAFTTAMTEQVHMLDKDLPVFDVRSMRQVIDQSVGDQRFSTYLFAFFALLALLLAAIGIYGVTSYSVAQRTREIGIRLALGANPADVMKLMLRVAMRHVLLGVTIGVVAALMLVRYLSSLLFGVPGSDLSTFTAVTILLVLVALVGCYIPARRAMRVDPMIALRHE
jgi:putative ABC transport system permease protein